MKEITHVEIYSKYNDDETARCDQFQMYLTANFYVNFDTISVNVKVTQVDDYGTNDERSSTSEDTFTIAYDSVMELVFEDIENCYHYLHALAVGHDGSHLNYMEINLKKAE